MTSSPTLTAACGALGRYDRNRVLAIAAALPGGASIVEEDRHSILALDRPPIRWGRGRRRGFAWSERVDEPDGAGLKSWEDAATAVAACGLVADGRRRYVHSTVSGAAALYFLEERDAVYFASTVDALARTASRTLSIDWEAWAAILTIHYPLGDTTPFAEIRRLEPYATLEWRQGRTRVSHGRWPWAEVEPRLSVSDGAPAVVEAARAAIERLPPGPLACPLTGGLDSRLCAGLLAERRRNEVTTLTIVDGPTDDEARAAAGVADALGLPHRTVTGVPADYWPELSERAFRVDYQFVRPPGMMSALVPLRGAGVVVDGFGFDTLAAPGGRTFTPEMLDPGGGGTVGSALWRKVKELHLNGTPATLRGHVARVLWASTRRQYHAESQRFRGHPARFLLTHWRTRQVRAVALNPFAVLGRALPVATPLAEDLVARSALAISPPSKWDFKLYLAAFDAIDERLARLPSTRMGPAPDGGRLAGTPRAQSAVVADAQHACLAGGPLSSWLRDGVLQTLSGRRRGMAPHTRPSALGVAYFHLWHERYASVLGEVDADAGLRALG